MPTEIVDHTGHVHREIPDDEREPFASAVLAEDLRALADAVPFEAQTRAVLAQAADRLDAEPLHEVECPSCSTTIRARMADQPSPRPELTDARIIDVLDDAWHAECPLDHPHPARHHAPQIALLLPAIRQLLAESGPPSAPAPTAALTTARARLLSAADEVVAWRSGRMGPRIQRLAQALADVRAELGVPTGAADA